MFPPLAFNIRIPQVCTEILIKKNNFKKKKNRKKDPLSLGILICDRTVYEKTEEKYLKNKVFCSEKRKKITEIDFKKREK